MNPDRPSPKSRSEEPLVEKRIVVTWLALMVLAASTVGSAYIPMGWFNGVANLAIAFVKAMLVMLVFMHLSKSGALIRLFAFGVFAWLLAMLALSLTDYITQPR